MIQTKTKIVATLGPSSNTEETLEAMMLAGMDIARLNFSHSTPEAHMELAERVRKVSDKLGKHIAIIGDLPGPKLRTGEVTDHNGILLTTGHEVSLVFDSAPTTAERISTTYPHLGEDVKIGDPILLDDGAIELVVTKQISSHEILAVVKSGGILNSHKGINFPSTVLRIPALTDHDRELVKIAVREMKVDAIALSFVRRPQDLKELRLFLKTELGDTSTPIIAKIEKPEAVDNIEGILDETDMIMVARGDLGVEMPLEKVPPIQKRIIDLANARGVPVITATQMLESMISHPRPTRAETSDVANAVFDGSDCVMLSAESSAGLYPIEAIRTMREIILAAEESGFVRKEEHYAHSDDEVENASDSVARAACVLAEDVEAQAIICATLSGRSAQAVAKFRFSKMVLGMSTDDTALRRMAFLHGVIPLRMEEIRTFEETLTSMISTAQRKDLIGHTGWVVLTAGHPIFQVSHTNIVKVQFLG